MTCQTTFHGARSARFPPIPSFSQAHNTNVGPSSYQEDRTKTSLLVPVSGNSPPFGTTSKDRVIEEKAPAPTAYNVPTNLQVLAKRITSTREYLNSSGIRGFPSAVSYADYADINYAVGRHVANDTQFSLLKNERLRKRERTNKSQIVEIAKVLGKEDGLFTDKRACRRMRHFALYFPQ